MLHNWIPKKNDLHLLNKIIIGQNDNAAVAAGMLHGLFFG